MGDREARTSTEHEKTRDAGRRSVDPTHNNVNSRLTMVEASHRFERVVLGERSTAVVPFPQNLWSTAATVRLSIDGDAFSLVSFGIPTLPVLAPTTAVEPGVSPAKIEFAPSTPGAHKGRLVIETAWPDGHTERTFVTLLGGAHTRAGREDLEPPKPAKNVVKGLVRLTAMRAINVDDEYVVGSRNTLEIAAPHNRTHLDGFAAVSLVGSPAFAASWGTTGTVVDLPAASTAEAIRVTFAPRTKGVHSAVLRLAAHWPDQHAEIQEVTISARARGLTDAPAAKTDTSAADAPARELPPLGDTPMTQRAVFQNKGLNEAVAGLFEHRWNGVHAVETEQGKYKAPPATRPLWMDLVEVALSLASDTIAKLLAPILTKSLRNAIGFRLPAVAARSVKPASVRTPQHVAGSEIPANDNALGAEPSGVDAMPAADELVSSLLSGLKAAGSLGAKTHLVARDTARDQNNSSGRSKNGDVDFFTSQMNALSDAKRAVGTQIELAGLHLDNLNSVAPGIGSAVIAEVDHAITDMRLQAQTTQMQHTAEQWFTYRTRASLGVEAVGERGVIASKLDAVREFDKLTAPRDARGLLSIHVVLRDGTPSVTAASTTSISALVADRIVKSDLRAAHVPVRIVLNGGDGYITRDEAGRVRYSGFIPLARGASPVRDELQQIRGAERIVDAVLGRSLEAWGVDMVSTDDQRPRDNVHVHAAAKDGAK